MAGAKRWPVPLKGLLSRPLPTQSKAGAATRDDTNPLACIVITAANLPFGGCTPGNAPDIITLPTSTNPAPSSVRVRTASRSIVTMVL